MPEPVKAAQALLDKFQVRDAQDINLRLMAADRRVLIQEKPISNAEGRLVYRNGRGTIIVNSSIRSAEKTRFVIAHELGHVEMHRDADNVAICDESALREYNEHNGRETQANEFAGELLLPQELFLAACSGAPPKIELLKYIATEFRASLESTAIRYVRIGQIPSALVYIQGGFVRWFWPSNEFPYKYVEPGSRPPAKSKAAQCIKGKCEQGVVTAKTWFGETAKPDQYFHEAVHFAPSYDRVLSILWEYKI